MDMGQGAMGPEGPGAQGAPNRAVVNPWAGEVEVVLNGIPYRAKLTLGALAELEVELGACSLMELVDRFEGGRFSARDVLALLLAGLRGGGWQGRAQDLAMADIPGGPVGASRMAAQLLVRAFALPEDMGASSAAGDADGAR